MTFLGISYYLSSVEFPETDKRTVKIRDKLYFNEYLERMHLLSYSIRNEIKEKRKNYCEYIEN